VKFTIEVPLVCPLAHNTFFQILASCSYDDSIKFFAFDGDDWVLADDIPNAHKSTVWAIAFNGAGDRLASVGDDRVLKIWQHYSPDGESGWLAKWFQTKKSSERAQWKCVCTISGFHSQPIYTVHWCPLTDLIATGCGDNAIRIFRESDSNRSNNILNEDLLRNQPEFEHVQTIENAHEQDVNCVRWNPKTSKLLLSCSDDGSVKLWRCCDTVSGQDQGR